MFCAWDYGPTRPCLSLCIVSPQIGTSQCGRTSFMDSVSPLYYDTTLLCPTNGEMEEAPALSLTASCELSCGRNRSFSIWRFFGQRRSENEKEGGVKRAIMNVLQLANPLPVSDRTLISKLRISNFTHHRDPRKVQVDLIPI